MEKRKPNDLPPEQCLAVDTDTITMNTRVLWSVQRIKEYLYDISG